MTYGKWCELMAGANMAVGICTFTLFGITGEITFGWLALVNICAVAIAVWAGEQFG